METFATVIPDIALWAPMAPTAVAILRIKSLGRGQRIFLVLSIFYLINQLFGEWLSHRMISNLPLFHLHIIVEFVFLSWVFFEEGGTFFRKGAQYILSVVFLLYGILNASFGEGLWNIPSTILVVESCLILLLIIFYFGKVFKEMYVERIEKEFLFWVSLGGLMYFAGSLIVSVFMEFLTSRMDVYFDVFLIRAVLIILTNICYAIGMLCKAHPQKS